MTQKTLFLLDAGHAPDTRGKRSPLMRGGVRLFEWDFARAVVDRIAVKLDALGIAYHVVTPRTNKDLGPTARASLANAVARNFPGLRKLMISIHGNAAKDRDAVQDGWSDAGGVTVLHHTSSRKSKKFAQLLQNKLVVASSLRDRGIKARNNLSILKRTSMPAILSECGFYTNKSEVGLLLSEDGRDMFADAHVAFIAEVEAEE